MSRFYEFDSFRIDAARRLLLRDGEPVPLKPKAFETLLALIAHRERIVGKDELIQILWPDTFVDESNLTQHVSLVRKALGEKASERHYIVTVPGRGYQFVAAVRESEGEEAGARKPETAGEALPPAGEGRKPGPSDAVRESTTLKAQAMVRARARRAAWAWKALAIGASLVAVGLGAFYLRHVRQATLAGAAKPIKSIAVLPFKTADNKNEDEYLSLGLTEALIAKFNGLSQVTVRQLSEVLKYGKPDQDPLAAGRALGVDAVVDGIIHKTGEQLRVTARLLDAHTGETVWAQTFDDEWTDIFTIQDTISLRVSEALMLNLTSRDRQRLEKRYTTNAEAYRLFLEGAYLFGKRDQESREKSIRNIQQAIALDPRFAPAYVALAQTFIEPVAAISPKEAYKKQKELALKALEIDETLPSAHASLGFAVWRGEKDWPAAGRAFKRALELSPNNPMAHHRLGIFLVTRGQFDEGIAHLRRAEELVISLNTTSVLGTAYLYARRYDKAVRQYQKALELEPNYAVAHTGLGWVYAVQGRYGEAIGPLRQAIKHEGLSVTNPRGFLGYVYAKMGRREEAAGELAELDKLWQAGRGAAGAAAVIYTGMGEKERAFQSLEQALERHEWWIFSLKVNPIFDELRSDPRFNDLVRRTGLEP